MSKSVHSTAKKEGLSTGVEVLLEGSKVLSAHSYGSSAWTVTARLNVILPSGIEKKFFLKVATEEPGRVMMEGEFNSMSSLYQNSPGFIPEPLTWGKFKMKTPETYFFLCDFINMTNGMPDPVQFCAKLAELHRTSEPPTEMFGFHVSTYHGRFAQEMAWDPSWTNFFTKLLRAALVIEKQECSPWPEFEAVSERTLSHVIPRILGALEEDGRQIKPSLIHGDLWEGNVGTNLSNGNVYIFDAGAYYAHHEMDIGMWRCERRKIKSRKYKRQYLRNMTVSKPAEEFEDRNRLYCIKMNIIHSAHHPGSIVRETAYNDMRYLVDKYAPYPTGEEPPRSRVPGEVPATVWQREGSYVRQADN
ncbi:hypothetical protein AA0113_g1281 [Alternaria arborescens]|uniref:protein-ribulosamine 3-kinase n=1 Tax=Alternaria arborescens TaxID=156630 RepID=A0A4Q4SMW4_9PLEO|nr:hypothetical protein AA0112_g4990 [Alternaria arborescens]RYO72170.1 hypothetical protein AA0113_g1281 [Alternaria arborescens]